MDDTKRPESSHSSDKDIVSPASFIEPPTSITDGSWRQDTFEDATETTPRPTSASRSRSLLARRESSSSSNAPEKSADTPVPEVPEVPKLDVAAAQQTADKEQQSASTDADEWPHVPTEAAETAQGEAPKSPSQTNRISVTSMDDVSLEEGEFPLFAAVALLARAWIVAQSSSMGITRHSATLNAPPYILHRHTRQTCRIRSVKLTKKQKAENPLLKKRRIYLPETPPAVSRVCLAKCRRSNSRRLLRHLPRSTPHCRRRHLRGNSQALFRGFLETALVRSSQSRRPRQQTEGTQTPPSLHSEVTPSWAGLKMKTASRTIGPALAVFVIASRSCG